MKLTIVIGALCLVSAMALPSVRDLEIESSKTCKTGYTGCIRNGGNSRACRGTYMACVKDCIRKGKQTRVCMKGEKKKVAVDVVDDKKVLDAVMPKTVVAIEHEMAEEEDAGTATDSKAEYEVQQIENKLTQGHDLSPKIAKVKADVLAHITPECKAEMTAASNAFKKKKGKKLAKDLKDLAKACSKDEEALQQVQSTLLQTTFWSRRRRYSHSQRSRDQQFWWNILFLSMI